MRKNEAIKILTNLSMSYTNFGNVEDKIKFWYDDLQYYDYNEVKNRINELMQTKEFGVVAPTLSRIIAPLTKTKDKIENSDVTYYCQFCHRGYNDKAECDEHEDRCRSVRYILRQYKRFRLGQIDKKFLYELDEKEFDIRYKKLLKLVQKHTNDEREKQRIEFIFNPPNVETAKEFLN